MNLRSFLFGLLVAAIIFSGYRIYSLELKVTELQRSADAYRWLSEGVVTLQDGTRVSRAQLLDLIISKSLNVQKDSR